MKKNLLHSTLILLSCCGSLLIAGTTLASAQGSELTPSSPFECRGDTTTVLRGRHIVTDGDGVVADENCSLLIEGSQIEAGGIGVRALGNSTVKILRSYVAGGSAALLAEGNSDIKYAESTFQGAQQMREYGEIEGAQGAAPMQGPTPGSVSVGGVVPGTVNVGGVSIRTGPGGVEVDTGTGTVVRGDGVRGSVESPTSTVTSDGDFVRIESAGTSIDVEGDDWRKVVTIHSGGNVTTLEAELGATVTAGVMTLQLAGDILFGFDSAEIRADAAAELAKVAYLIRQRAGGEVTVIGHSDSIGEEAYNQQLSERRAVAVMRWLNESEQIPISLMRGRGLGELEPIAYNSLPDGSDNPAGRARNRRVEMQFGVR